MGQKLIKLQENAGNACFYNFATFKTQFHNILGQNLKKSLDSPIFYTPLAVKTLKYSKSASKMLAAIFRF